jgi:hypothetical protein
MAPPQTSTVMGSERQCIQRPHECGHQNPMGELEIPAALIREQLRRLETAPAYCLVCVLVLAIAAFVLCYPDPESGPCAYALFALSVPGWLLCADAFGRNCLHQRGWRRALWRYHLYGLSACAVVLAPFGILTWYAISNGAEDMAWCFLPLAAPVLIAIIGRWARRRGLRLMEPLQRAVAVGLARGSLRKRLRSKC